MEKQSTKRKPKSPTSLSPKPLMTKRLKSSLRIPQIFNSKFDEKVQTVKSPSKDEEVLDIKIIEKINELKMKLKPLIEKDIYYIDNKFAIENAERLSKDLKERLDKELNETTIDRVKRNYFIAKYNSSLELLNILRNRVNNPEWFEIRKVLEIIKKEHNDIYIIVFNILTKEIKIAEEQTEQSMARAHYLFWLKNKDNIDVNKIIEFNEVLNFLTEYKLTNRESHDLMLKTVLTRAQKNPTIESINIKNAKNSKIPLLDIKPTKISYAQQKSCVTTEDCDTPLENCINKLCILSKITEPSDMFKNTLERNKKHNKDMAPYPSSFAKIRDVNGLITGQRVRVKNSL